MMGRIGRPFNFMGAAMIEFSDDLKKVLQKIEIKGFRITADGLVSIATGLKVRKSSDIELVNSMLSLADTSIEAVQQMMASERNQSVEAEVVAQALMPLVDGRLANPPVNQADRDLLQSVRVPYAEDRENQVLSREEGCLIYLDGNTARRVAAETLRVGLPHSLVESIDRAVERYISEANGALIRLSKECTNAGCPEAIHQRLTEWLLENVPSCMIPVWNGKAKGLQIRCIKNGKTFIPCEIIGWRDPFEALEAKKGIVQHPDFFIKNLKSLSNDPNEIAVNHIDLNNLPDGETPTWEEVKLKFTDDEWSVLCAYIWATFDMTNNSRQALYLFDSGHTGKSTLFEVLKWALGKENAATPEPLQSPKTDKFFMSTIYGRRAAFIPDCKNPQLLNTGWVHGFTGGDSFSIQFKNRNAFSAKCYGKVFIGTNTPPCCGSEAEHIKTRLIILRPKLTQEALNILGQRDSDGEFVRDDQGKVLLKGDPNFEQNLRNEFWAFLKKCRAYYDVRCPDGSKIELPQSVLANADIAEDYTTSAILELCDNLFTFGENCTCHLTELRDALEDELLRSNIKGMDVPKILQILAENRGIVHKKAIRINGIVKSGYVGLEPKIRSELDDIMNPDTPLNLSAVDLSDL